MEQQIAASQVARANVRRAIEAELIKVNMGAARSVLDLLDELVHSSMNVKSLKISGKYPSCKLVIEFSS
jgi:hypothetical protein